MIRRFLTASLMAVAVLLPGSAKAHFLWLVVDAYGDQPRVNLYFSESASPDDPDLLDRVADVKAHVIKGFGRRQQVTELDFKKQNDALIATIPADSTGNPVVLNHTYGVISRGGKTFLLNYCARTVPSALPGTWRAVDNGELLPLEIVPEQESSTVAFRVLWKGKAVAGATINVEGPGLKEAVEGTTDETGVFRCALPSVGNYSIRARHIEEVSGEIDGDEYASSRHYSTLTLPYVPAHLSTVAHSWPDLPRATTSFGGAVAGDWLYVYGGHYGQAHHYSQEGQSGDFRRLNLKNPGEWESLPGGPKLTGLALVAHGDVVYRIGGFTAKNNDDQEQDLWSQDDFARFDPATNKWENLPPLPEPRSSLDAAVVGDALFVVGGWKLQGKGETQWHDTAWSVDLSTEKLEWKPIASPPFHRRALALAAWNGKLYVIGGMRKEGGPTTQVSVYNPADNAWTEGPSILGGDMDGFGCSAFAADGRLFVTTMSGSIQRLAKDGSTWEYMGQLSHPRFFHRMLPWQSNEFVIVGGASMMTGKIDELERLPVTPK